MSAWRSKALELFPEFRERFLEVKDRMVLWKDIEQEFHTAKRRKDFGKASRCIQYAIWTLIPTPQAKTLANVSTEAARLLYAQADELHHWINRHEFLQAQRGLRLHLGDQQYSEFESRFLEKTTGYPKQNSKRVIRK